MDRYAALVGLFLLHIVLLGFAIRLLISSMGVWLYSEGVFKNSVIRLCSKGWEPRKAALQVALSMRFVRYVAPVLSALAFAASGWCLRAFLDILE